MAKQIILHVGTEKTGTTSIQEYLSAVRPALEESGWLYPSSLGSGPHIQLTACCLDFSPNASLLKALGIASDAQLERHRERVLKRLTNEVATSTSNKIIISDEHINVHLCTIEILERLHALLRNIGTITKIVLYLRRQDRLYMSMKSEALKNSLFHVHNLKDPIHTFHVLPYRFNYAKIVENIQSAFPKSEFVLRPFIDSPDFDVLADFRHTLRLTSLPVISQAARQNLSLPNAAFRSLILIGALASKRNDTALLSHWRTVLNLVANRFPGPPARLSAAESAEFMTRFQSMNRKLIDEYPQLGSALHSKDLDTELTGSYPPSNLEPLTLSRAISDSLPTRAANTLEKICFDLSQADDDYALAFPPEVRERWEVIKQKNLQSH